MIGTTLSHYRITAAIGAGGMGQVYRATDTKLGRDVALKTLPESFAGDPGWLARFEREARVIASLSHPNILAIYDFGEAQGTTYLAMELLEGETLRERLGAGALPVRKAVEVAVQIAQGLAAAHEKGIIHRDLKPENVIVGRDGLVKILDFGLARQRAAVDAGDTRSPTIAPPTDPGTLLGTAGYMSPEQVRGETADHRSDIFSFGCVLYEMLTGRRAFHGATAVQTMNAILTADPAEVATVVADVPPALARIVTHCLEKSPGERFQSARDIAFDLQSLSTLSREAVPSGSLAAARRRTGTMRAAVAAALLGVGALAGFIVASLLKREISPVFTSLTFRRGLVSSALFTPDGKTVVYGAAWEGTPIQSYSTRIGAQESAPLGLPTGDVLSVSPSGELLVSLGRRYTQGYETTGRLARAPLTGGAPRELLDNVMEASWAPDGRRLVIVREAGDRCRLELGAGNVLYETAGWIQNARLSPRGDLVAFIEHPFRRADNGMVCVIPAAGGKRKVLTRELSAVQGAAWAGGEIWYTGADSGSRMSLYAITSEGRRRLLLQSPVDLHIHDVDPQGRALLTGNHVRMGTIYGLHGAGDDRELSWLDYSFGLSLTPDGQTVVLNEQGEGAGPRYGVYLRKVDGSPAVRLGDGYKGALSPDGLWVLTMTQDDPQRLVLLPTGPGEARTLPAAGLRYQSATWFPDGKRIAFAASAPDHGVRLYAQDLDHGAPVPFTAEGIGLSTPWLVVSPDGKWAAATGEGQRPFLFPTNGGSPMALSWLEPGDGPQRFSADGRVLFCMRSGMTAGEIVRAELDTRARSVWESIRPDDTSGVLNVRPSDVTPDGRHYVYIYSRCLSDLFLVEGLR